MNMQEQDSKLSKDKPPEDDSDDASHFHRSLQELKELRSQLYYAADYCETTFLNAQPKNMVMENTKEYLCRAVVTVVDHLGSISANLDDQLSKTKAFADVELQIDTLKNRLITCQQYSQKLALSKMLWPADFPKYHPRYMSPTTPNLRSSKNLLRESSSGINSKTRETNEFETREEVPLLLYEYNFEPCLDKDPTKEIDANTSCNKPSTVLPVRETIHMQPKARNPSFHFEANNKLKRNILNWKTVPNTDILAIIRRSKPVT